MVPGPKAHLFFYHSQALPYLSLKIYIYIYIYLAALGLSCSTQDLCCGVWGFLLQHPGSVVAACGLSSCGTWALEHMGLVAPWHVGS